MRVVVSPRCEREAEEAAQAVARGLAGPQGKISALEGVSVQAFRRDLSEAEKYQVRAALLGGDPDTLLGSGYREGCSVVVGYVCAGRRAGAGERATVLGVTDHLNLAWRSPLAGIALEKKWGPRFPRVAGLYAPDAVAARLDGECALPVRCGVVAGVYDPEELLAFEEEVVRRHRLQAVSSELVPVALLAAQLGIRLAAAMVITG